MCDLNPLCTYYSHDFSNNKCLTFTDQKEAGGDSEFGVYCHKKLDPPTLRFSREPGECARVDGSALTLKTSRLTVADAGECETICQNFHATCKGFSFESTFGTCYTIEDSSEIRGDLVTDRVCHIRMTEEEVTQYYGPDLPATSQAGVCVT